MAKHKNTFKPHHLMAFGRQVSGRPDKELESEYRKFQQKLKDDEYNKLSREEQMALVLYSYHPWREAAEKAGISAFHLRNLLNKFKIKKENYYWTAANEKFLIENWDKMTAIRIGKRVKATKHAVNKKIQILRYEGKIK